MEDVFCCAGCVNIEEDCDSGIMVNCQQLEIRDIICQKCLDKC